MRPIPSLTPRVPFAWRKVALAAAQLALGLGPAVAADTTWTGAAPTPFWDLGANWSAGPPAADSTRALLGRFDTTLRSGAFRAHSVLGDGTLSISGGSLRLQADGSSVGALNFSAGRLYGPGALATRTLQWSGGSLYSIDGSASPRLTVLGAAHLSGTIDLGNDGDLKLLGETLWTGSYIGGNTVFRIPRGGRFLDRAASGDHNIGVTIGVSNEGDYEKTGSYTTTIAPDWGSLENSGRFAVREGRVAVQGNAGSIWSNSGSFIVAGGSVDVTTYRGSHSNSGRIEILDGEMRFNRFRTLFNSTGDWIVGAAGRMIQVGSVGDWLNEPMEISAGRLHNDGLVRWSEDIVSVSAAARLSGRGRYEVLGGSQLSVDGALDIGTLRIADPFAVMELGSLIGYAQSEVRVAGRLDLDRLEWADGRLVAGGPVTVAGAVVLSENLEYSLRSPPDPPGKKMDQAFHFRGGVDWDGQSDLYGAGSIRVDAGTVFQDRNRAGTASGSGEPRPTRVAVESFHNAGTYLKTGAGHTVVASRFDNSGSVRNVGAGTLTFTGAFDNRGSVEADGARVVVFGPLAQHATPGLLSDGRWVMRDGRVVLNLGSESGGLGPVLIHSNAADVLLDGPRARLATTWAGDDIDALSGLRFNTGRLVLQGGATLVHDQQLDNDGWIEVGAGSLLSTRFYTQGQLDEPGAWTIATWLGGTLRAREVSFRIGSFGAGLGDAIGNAQVLSDTVHFIGARFDLDIASLTSFDLVAASGKAVLGGTLDLDVLGAVPELGVYRFLTAAGGIEGRFEDIASELDRSLYAVALVYGDTYVDLRLSPAPEPSSWALMGLGLAALVAGSRRAQQRRAGA
ncbi:PEP-CTERM sorting domain-containing protein [Aquabacterium sp. A7-Y]|uniref:PEP-CTERM sorting domain-containing protein n=1 Tax=Aquabacterium sp. A7-Y TaxID=1349605 RepID=UPI00223D95E0|nr:PEP-CTERM sorting domain-containing protein [Aquabacterium sp. A7-Y]MCW7538616.1 PEP-CTERM sorting domain-containing protein [Aquabacterium sp. A7-Y]